MTESPLEPHFRGEGPKISSKLQKRKWNPWITVSKTVNFLRIGWTIIEKSPPEQDQKWHVYAICCRPEVVGDVIFSENEKTIEGYAVLNFDFASFSTSREIFFNRLLTAEDIDDSIKRKRIRVSFKNVESIHGYMLPNLEVSCWSSLW